MNLVRTRVRGEGAPFGSFTVPMSPQQRAALGSDGVVVGARPEAMRISTNGDGLEATIMAVEELGSDSYLYCETQLNGSPTMLTVRSAGLSDARPGDRVMVAPDLRAVHLLDEASGCRLPD
jgi:ABC-type sugar transport system ATPase subunit